MYGALGPSLRAMLSDYWSEYRRGYPHFLLEGGRFGSWLSRRIDRVEPTAQGPVSLLLQRDLGNVRAALAASQSMAAFASEVQLHSLGPRSAPSA